MDQELDEELQSHFHLAIRERIERGEDPREAERAVRREFGNYALVRETTRGQWGWNLWEEIWQDARYALRGMRANRGFTVVAVSSLALGIGANTAIFSLVYAVLLRPLPVSHPEQLVELLQRYPGEPRRNGSWTLRDVEYYRQHNHAFSAITGMAIDNLAELRIEEAGMRVGIAEYVLGNYFAELGLRPALGRLIGQQDEKGSAVAVISWDLWTARFHRDPAVLGKRVQVDKASLEIIGVAPRDFTGLRIEAKTDLWTPAGQDRGFHLIARLKHGNAITQARTGMAQLFRFTIEERAARSSDPQLRQLRVEVETCAAGFSTVRDRMGNPLTMLMAISGVLLVLACLNLASMMLARGAGRAREMALRLGLGASRGRLLRQSLTESLLLSGAGTLAGAIVAWSGIGLFTRIIASGRPAERIQLDIQPEATVLLFAAGAALLTGLFFGLAPAWAALRSLPACALRPSGKAADTRGNRFFGKSLVAAQVSLSIVLLGAGVLFITHLLHLRSADLGFRRDYILLVNLDPSGPGIRGEQLSQLYQRLLERMNEIPGVRMASLSAPTPLHGAGASGFGTVEGVPQRPEDRRWISISWVGPRYFETMGTPLLAGREFTLRDQSNPRIAIINSTLASQYFGGQDPLGRRIILDHVTGMREPAAYEIVGVAGDANYMEIREKERRGIFLPAFRAGRVTAGTFVLRTDINPHSVAASAQRVAAEVAPSIPVTNTTTLSDQIEATIVPERLMAMLSGFFALLGALLAGIGIYGLLAYTVARRTNEIGIRMALGASRNGIVRMVLQEALAITGAGVAIGIPAAFWGHKLAAVFLAELSTTHVAAILLAAVAILAVALLASCIPARRAAAVDPMVSLRHE